ncbi:hypothetical protein PCAR4_570042 [Paraburkholderia caribensis]|nr:hypothetical protein PCAR4_570042 [Paraburkholderia caribensis]
MGDLHGSIPIAWETSGAVRSCVSLNRAELTWTTDPDLTLLNHRVNFLGWYKLPSWFNFCLTSPKNKVDRHLTRHERIFRWVKKVIAYTF